MSSLLTSISCRLNLADTWQRKIKKPTCLSRKPSLLLCSGTLLVPQALQACEIVHVHTLVHHELGEQLVHVVDCVAQRAEHGIHRLCDVRGEIAQQALVCLRARQAVLPAELPVCDRLRERGQ